jgi:hypothetical protein
MTHGSRPEEVERARAEVRVAEAELEDTRLTHERLEELLGSDLASRQLTDDAKTHFLADRSLPRTTLPEEVLAEVHPALRSSCAMRTRRNDSCSTGCSWPSMRFYQHAAR